MDDTVIDVSKQRATSGLHCYSVLILSCKAQVWIAGLGSKSHPHQAIERQGGNLLGQAGHPQVLVAQRGLQEVDDDPCEVHI